MQPTDHHESDFHHDPVRGRDGIVRCRYCNTAMSRGGQVTPCSVPCPSLDRSMDSLPMATSPVNAFLMDLLTTTPSDTEEMWTVQNSDYRLPFEHCG